MTTLTKVASSLSDTVSSIKDRFCNDGQFCDDVGMGLLTALTMWMMVVAMQPIL